MVMSHKYSASCDPKFTKIVPNIFIISLTVNFFHIFHILEQSSHIHTCTIPLIFGALLTKYQLHIHMDLFLILFQCFAVPRFPSHFEVDLAICGSLFLHLNFRVFQLPQNTLWNFYWDCKEVTNLFGEH